MSTRYAVIETDKETGKTTQIGDAYRTMRLAAEAANTRHYARGKQERERYGLEVVPEAVEQ